jgi:hypothetical protein
MSTPASPDRSLSQIGGSHLPPNLDATRAKAFGRTDPEVKEIGRLAELACQPSPLGVECT